jgi:hypothetical protein
MLAPLLLERFTPVVVVGFDVINPISQFESKGSFSFEQDLIHVIGIVDKDGRMYKIYILDPINFGLDKSLLRVEEVAAFDSALRFKYDLQTDVVEVYSE